MCAAGEPRAWDEGRRAYLELLKKTLIRFPMHWTHRQLAVPRCEVEANFARYGLLDDRVRFLAGWFRNSLPSAPIEKLALLRLDGDMYESTAVALHALHPKVQPGGYVIVDDYHALVGCRQAVDDYRRANQIRRRSNGSTGRV